MFAQPPVLPGELARAYAGTESSGLPVDALTQRADAVGGRDYVLSAGCADAGTGVRLAFVFTVSADGDPTAPAQEQVAVPCDRRLHDVGVHADVSGVVQLQVADSPGTSPDYVALVRARRVGDARIGAPRVDGQPVSSLSVPAAGPVELARATPGTGPVDFTATRGQQVRVVAACAAGRPGAVARWHIDAGTPAAPLADGSGKADGAGSDASGSDDTIASAVLACDGRPHVSTHILVTTGGVSLALDRDAAGQPQLFSVTVSADVVAPAAPTAEAPGSRPTPVG